MEAIVLAGGFGTRLQTVVSEVPKPMAPINDEPFLKYLFTFLKKNNVKKVILSICYKKELIMDFFGSEYDGIEVVYSIEEEALGTGGAIKQSLSMCNKDDVLILNGDTFFDVELDSLMQKHKSNNSDLTLSLKPMEEFDRYGIVNISENDKIIGFEEKKYCDSGLINGGVYVIKKNLLDHIKEQKFSFETFMNKNYAHNKFYSFISNTYFIDIGIPEDYYKAQKELVDVI